MVFETDRPLPMYSRDCRISEQTIDTNSTETHFIWNILTRTYGPKDKEQIRTILFRLNDFITGRKKGICWYSVYLGQARLETFGTYTTIVGKLLSELILAFLNELVFMMWYYSSF